MSPKDAVVSNYVDQNALRVPNLVALAANAGVVASVSVRLCKDVSLAVRSRAVLVVAVRSSNAAAALGSLNVRNALVGNV